MNAKTVYYLVRSTKSDFRNVDGMSQSQIRKLIDTYDNALLQSLTKEFPDVEFELTNPSLGYLSEERNVMLIENELRQQIDFFIHDNEEEIFDRVFDMVFQDDQEEK